MDIQNATNNKMSAIDRALAAAKARKTQQSDAAEAATPTDPATDAEAAAKEAARAARKAQAEADREFRAQARAEKKAARLAAKEKPAHMKKVERAGSRLPELSAETKIVFGDVTANLSAQQISALALHLQHHNRVVATTRAIQTQLAIGQTVTIVGGDPKFIGRTGTIDRVQRIRCYVNLKGSSRPYYCFTSDVAPVAAEVDAAAQAG